MRTLLKCLFLFPILILAENYSLLQEQENLQLYHHVNVISGHLNLAFQDLDIPGPVPFTLNRTYTSAGALEKDEDDKDLKLKKFYNDWPIQGGWQLLPHLHLVVHRMAYEKDCSFSVNDKTGIGLVYEQGRKEDKEYIFTAQPPSAGYVSALNARNNLYHSYLKYDFKKHEARLFLPDGTIRTYAHLNPKEILDKVFPLVLILEVTPSKHRIEYRYDDKHHLTGIKIKNPDGSKTFSSVRLEMLDKGGKNHPFYFQVTSSSNQVLNYRSEASGYRHYIHSVKGNSKNQERYEYKSGRKGLGARLKSLDLDGKLQFVAHYYEPSSKELEKKWADDPDKKEFYVDKVSRLEAPLGPNDTLCAIAKFSYCTHYTDVTDAEQLKIRYHHHKGKLTWIEYFDAENQVHSSIKLFYEGSYLKAKARLNGKGEPLFSKVFDYDKAGNVIRETFYGQFTGKETKPMVLKSDGKLVGAETSIRTYRYDPKTHLMIEETQEEGLSYTYAYKRGTDLMTAKWTHDEGKIVARQFFFYDSDHLLIGEMTDDGSSSNPDDLSDVTERHYKRYTLHPKTGMPIEVKEAYLDKGVEKQLNRIEYSYSPENRVEAERIFDATDHFCYALFTKHDSYGRIISRTTPTGFTNSYKYGAQGELISNNEEASLAKEFVYNAFGLPILCTSIDREGNRKSETFTYDIKGRVLAHTDEQGNITTQTYNEFGQCFKTQFPLIQTSDLGIVRPEAFFEYDDGGNLAGAYSLKEDKTHTTYNTLGKPLEIVEPDGFKTCHIYNKRGVVLQTVYPDETTAYYTYDKWERMTAKRVFSPQEDLLSEELWVYNAFHLKSHTDIEGKTTFYTYDSAGRVIKEEVEGFSRSYFYNALGLLEKTTQGELTHVQELDSAGRMIQQWDEDNSGRIENHTTFFYNQEGKKNQAIRNTSKGEVVDQFKYDAEGRLTTHVDPLGAITQWIYADVSNSLGQTVLQKVTIDPLGCFLIHTYDPLGHLATQEKQNPSKQSIAKETYQYDVAGQRTARTVTLYQGIIPLKEITTYWEYDHAGRIVKQIEPEDRITQYFYSCRGNLIKKILPSGIYLTYTYDGIGRLKELESSNRTVHYCYHYLLGSQPTEIYDLATGSSLKREYNASGQLIREINPYGLITKWDYDTQGRVSSLTLPDLSKIVYVYTGNHLTSVERHSKEGQYLYAHQYLDFDPAGHVSEESLIYALGTQYSDRDELERPLTQHSPWFTQTLTYGPSGLIGKQTNSFLGNKTFTYDFLSQLTQENEEQYAFDSLGNPLNCKINDHNQILSTPTSHFDYDLDGNTKERTTPDNTTHYDYDALGRLSRIVTEEKEILYVYDPLSRLISKTLKIGDHTTQTLYLHDNQKEIGTCTPDKKILELKVLGLGIQGDIGAAVAIELGEEVFAPLHDFSGHIIALIAKDGTIHESYSIDAFGSKLLDRVSSNPWCFSSKRQEENLIYFGYRFYDLHLGRWLTPDPAGFIDSPNLYLYVLNNPINRLDLFGLNSEPTNDSLKSLETQLSQIPQGAQMEKMITGKLRTTAGLSTDFFLIGSNWHQLNFSAEELESNRVNLADHFLELFSPGASGIQLATVANGVFTSFNQFKDMGGTVRKAIPDVAWILGVHNPSFDPSHVIDRLSKEFLGVDTPEVILLRQTLVAFSKTLDHISPKALFLHLSHSEGGMQTANTRIGMTPDEQALINSHMLHLSFAPARPSPKTYGVDAINIYSDGDLITLGYSKPFLNDPDYDIRIVLAEGNGSASTINTPSNLTGALIKAAWTAYDRVEKGVFEHGFSNPTLNKQLGYRTDYIRDKYGFYNGKTR